MCVLIVAAVCAVKTINHTSMEYVNMDKRFKISKILIRNFIFLLLFASFIPDQVNAFGFDSANSCSPNGKQSRRGRAQMLAAIPCDLTQQAYCQQPGTAYPWHAVRRFVHENQGLMKRMYGDVRHISILRDEIQNNEIDMEDVEMAADRYSRDGGGQRRSSKFMHNREEYGGPKNNDVLKEPHFRPVSTTTTSTTTTTTTTTTAKPVTTFTGETTTLKTTTGSNSQTTSTASFSNTPITVDFVSSPSVASGEDMLNKSETSDSTTSNKSTPKTIIKVKTELDLKAKDNLKTLESLESDEDLNEEDDADDGNLESNSVYETITSPQTDLHIGDNIQIIESPQLGLNNITEAATISTTLKKIVVTTARPETVVLRRRPQPNRQRSTPAPIQQKQPKLPQQLHKVSSTVLKESSILKSKFNESERIPSTSSSAPLVKGAAATTASLKKNNNNSSSSSSGGVSGSGANKNGNKNNHNNSPTEPAATATANANASLTASSTSQSSFASSSSSSSFPHADLLSGEKLRKQPTTPIASPAVVPTSSTKPVLRDGQLFQDTMKQEQAPAAILRGVNACPVKEEVVAPFWANNTRGEVLALLNLYPFEQYVHWEKCTHENKQMYCREGCRCEQQYRLHRLLAYDPHNECRGIFSDWFRFPSCCICKCYDITPQDFRATSRSPRSESGVGGAEYRHPIEIAEEEVKKAIYEHATEEWYRPKDEFDSFEN